MAGALVDVENKTQSTSRFFFEKARASKGATKMRVQSAPSLQALSEQQDEAVPVSEARGLSIYVSIRK